MNGQSLESLLLQAAIALIVAYVVVYGLKLLLIKPLMRILRNPKALPRNPKDQLRDTDSSMTWSRFLEIIKDYGFEIVVRRQFDYSFRPGEKPAHPEFVIAAHRQKYLLLCATSWVGSTNELLNAGKVYGTLKTSGANLRKDQNFAINGCSYEVTAFGLEFDYDVRYGLASKLDELSHAFEFVPWHNPNRFLWLMDYSQEAKEKDYWKRYRDDFLNRSPHWVLRFII